MKNYEKYIDEVLKITSDQLNRCDFIRLYMLKKPCSSDRSCISCKQQLKQWLMEEYVKPEIDWAKVPIDTPVMVRDYDHQEWQKKHFAIYLPQSDYKFYAFAGINDRENAKSTEIWKQCKLADGVDATPFLKGV